MIHHAPPPTKYGPQPIGQAKAASTARRNAPKQPPPATRYAPHSVAPCQAIQRAVLKNPYDDLIGIEDPGFRGQYRFIPNDFDEGAGYYVSAVAKVNGYVFGKYNSGSTGHAEEQALNELHKVTFAARQGRDMFLDPPSFNKLTIYITKSPCSSAYDTTENNSGCTEKIIQNQMINGYKFQIKVRYCKLYVPKGIPSTIKAGPKDRSAKAVKHLNDHGVDAMPISDNKYGRKITGHRKDPHPFREV